MNCAGHGVGTPLGSRPSLSPGGVAPAARWPSSAHPLPTVGGVVASGGGVGTGHRLSSFVTGVVPLRPADLLHTFRREARNAWVPGEARSPWVPGAAHGAWAGGAAGDVSLARRVVR